MYSFSYDPDRALMYVVKKGYWSLDKFHAFETDFLAHHRETIKKQPDYRLFGDCTEYSVQSVEVSEAYTQFFDIFSQINRNRFAILVSSILAKMQAKHAMSHDIVEVFTDREEAMTWLFSKTDSRRG